MKKKSILLLLLVCLFSLVIGTIGCTTTSSSESESTTEESISEEDSESYVAVVIEPEVYDDVLAANTKADLIAGLADTNYYAINYNFQSGELEGFTASYLYYKVDDAYHSQYALSDGETRVAYSLYEEDASYSIDKDGNLVYGIYPGTDKQSHALSIGFVDFSNYKLSGDVSSIPGKIFFDATYKNKNANTLTTMHCVANEETLAFEVIDFVVCDLDSEEVLEEYSVEFAVCEGTPDVDLTAKQHILNVEEAESVIEFELILNPEGESETRQYAVPAGVKIVMDNDAEGNTYTFYKNHKCTKDIEDLAEILVDYNGATVYATVTGPQISFDFTLTEADVEQMNSYIEVYLQLVTTSPSFDEIENQRAYVEDMMGYFVHQYYMGQIQYYMDITKQAGKDAFNFAQETYNDMYDAYITMYRTVYEMTDNEYSIWMFEDWTEEDLAILYQDNEAISELESANTQIEQDFNDLANDADWSYNVEVLYEQLVANNQQLAQLHGYENAYDYMAADYYHRNYSDEERAAFYSNVAKYVNGFYNKAMTNWNSVNAGIDTDLYQRYNLVANKSTKSLKNEYLSGYINSYNNSLNQKMKDMYEKKAVKFALSSNSQGTAYVNYSSYYEEGFAFFGSGYQDLLTVVHEMGHYVANSSYSLSSMGYDLAETQSQGNEWMMLYYLKDKIDVDVHEVMYSLRLANSMYIVLYASIVDAFEYKVYTAETPYVAGEYKAVLEEVLDELGVGADKVDEYFDYIQKVTLLSPVYYLNYATSELTAISFYTMAEQEGYEVAQEAYRRLQEECDTSLSYAEIIADLGLRGPFEESTYRSIDQVFFGE